MKLSEPQKRSGVIMVLEPLTANVISDPVKVTFNNDPPKVSEFQGRIVKKLAEHIGRHNTIRALWYLMIDAFTRFYLSCRNPINYKEYLKYSSSVAQIVMAKISEEETIKTGLQTINDNIKAKIKAKETKPDERLQLKEELKKRMTTIEELERLRKEAKDIKDNHINAMKICTLWKCDEFLYNEIEKIVDEKVEAAQIKKICEWINEYGSPDLKKKIQNQKNNRECVKVAKEFLKERIQHDQDKAHYEDVVFSRLKERLGTQVESVKTGVIQQKEKAKKAGLVLSPSIYHEAKEQIRKIVKNFDTLKNLNQKLEKFKDINIYNDQLNILENFLKNKQEVKEVRPAQNAMNVPNLEQNRNEKEEPIERKAAESNQPIPRLEEENRKEVATPDKQMNQEIKQRINEESPPSNKQAQEDTQEKISIEPLTKPKTENLNEEQIKTLRVLLPKYAENRFTDLIDYLNSIEDKDKEIEFIKKLKKWTADFKHFTFNQKLDPFQELIRRLYLQEEKYKTIIFGLDEEKLKSEFEILNPLHEAYIAKIGDIHDTSIKEFQNKLKALIQKLVIVNEALNEKNLTVKT